ncbi:hypothetical protein DB34_03425 [Acetobacter pasteurianus]|nr:hypothetical protein [Acetobacter pasteurianus]AKR48095.2 hypothetical protein DB34_03425 [Acetobacter pasteurianus]
MEMVACIILTDIQAMAPYMMIIMVTAFGAAVAAAHGRRGQVLARRGGVPVAMVGVLALGHAQVVAEVVAHLVEEVPVAMVDPPAQVVAVTDNLATAAFFKV